MKSFTRIFISILTVSLLSACSTSDDDAKKITDDSKEQIPEVL